MTFAGRKNVKPKLRYLLFDVPSDHKIEGALSTECQAAEAIIDNQGMPARVTWDGAAAMDAKNCYKGGHYENHDIYCTNSFGLCAGRNSSGTSTDDVARGGCLEKAVGQVPEGENGVERFVDRLRIRYE